MTSLLSLYRREKMKIKKSMGTGKGRDDIFVSTWFAYKHFQFLTEKDAPVNRIDTETRDNKDDIENVSDNVDIEHDMPGVLDEMNESKMLFSTLTHQTGLVRLNEMELYSKNQYVSASSESSSGYTPQQSPTSLHDAALVIHSPIILTHVSQNHHTK
ncbi:uncharacterized protein [Diabrotica undecimpunctata]|uniref:uncharacterized protein n=1 Tax=Diabrotica undecimpunctata TaxID=50387 RepID=UPI003B631B95